LTGYMDSVELKQETIDIICGGLGEILIF